MWTHPEHGTRLLVSLLVVLVSTQVAHRKFGAAKMMRKVYLQRAALLACGAAALAAVLVPACDAAATKVTKAWCHTMHKRHRVKPHVNWGTMMDERSQEKWMALLCDNELVEASKLGGSEVATDETPALNQDITWCESTQSSHNVVPGTTWGTLSAAGQETWRNKACDAILPKPTRPAKSRDMTACAGDWASAPMIAICFGSTTRGVVKPGPETMTLFRYLLPSVQVGLEERFLACCETCCDGARPCPACAFQRTRACEKTRLEQWRTATTLQ